MTIPNFSYENKLLKRGLGIIAGCDEVGRGCFAGPIVAAAVAFPPQLLIHRCIDSGIRIDDSKKLTAMERQRAGEWIKKNALSYGIGVGSVSEINRLGMAKATNRAFRRAINNANYKLDVKIEYLLIDAFFIPYVRGVRRPIKTKKPKNLKSERLKNLRTKKIYKGNAKNILNKTGKQAAIINGDQKSFSIAAASIIAKVYRDGYMERLSKKSKFKKYKWGINKGYGTKEHRNVILKHGISKYHRIKFVDTYINNFYSSQAR